MRLVGGCLLLLIISLSILFGCRSPDADETVTATTASDPIWFTDNTDAVGLKFDHDPGPLKESYFLPQIIGSGAAIFDANNDGLLDIYLIQNGGPSGARNRLFLQRSDGTFADVSAGSGLDVAGYGMGVAVGDVNNDGLPDVYLTGYGGDRLFLNQGNGRFIDATKSANIDNPIWGTSASFFDYDRDGWLDLVVVNYLALDSGVHCRDATGERSYCHPDSYSGTPARLYRNKGVDAAGKWLGFEDRSGPSGVAARPGPGLGVLCADFNGDRWPDIFVANDAKPNHLWINQKDGTFKEEAVSRGVAFNGLGQAQGNMGVAYGDVDGDGLADMFVTHLINEYHTLWRQSPRGRFLDRTAEAGLTRGRWRGTGFGTLLADFDNDGALDLAIVNGAVARTGPQTAAFWECYTQRNQLFANDGRGSFRDISEANSAFCGRSGVSRGLAVGDMNGDGALDLLVTQIGGPARLYRNVAPNRGHWLIVRALLRAAPRDAVGAEIHIRTGDRRWTRLVQPGQSYLCSNDPRAHFGLGSFGQVDEIVIAWPDGSEEVFPGGGVDRSLVLRQGEGRLRPALKEGP